MNDIERARRKREWHELVRLAGREVLRNTVWERLAVECGAIPPDWGPLYDAQGRPIRRDDE